VIEVIERQFQHIHVWSYNIELMGKYSKEINIFKYIEKYIQVELCTWFCFHKHLFDKFDLELMKLKKFIYKDNYIF